jgi:hypothetical protein
LDVVLARSEFGMGHAEVAVTVAVFIFDLSLTILIPEFGTVEER